MFRFIINPPVFFGSVSIILLLLGVGAFFPHQAEALLSDVEARVLAEVGWFYLLAVGIFLFSVTILCISRYGNLKLGPDDCEPDCNGNGTVDECDIAGGEPDCNDNGVPDETDISSGTSTDCDGNTVPDECQDDCNTNGVADPCDITAGTSLDCDGNSEPDECQADCNGSVEPQAPRQARGGEGADAITKRHSGIKQREQCR